MATQNSSWSSGVVRSIDGRCHGNPWSTWTGDHEPSDSHWCLARRCRRPTSSSIWPDRNGVRDGYRNHWSGRGLHSCNVRRDWCAGCSHREVGLIQFGAMFKECAGIRRTFCDDYGSFSTSCPKPLSRTGRRAEFTRRCDVERRREELRGRCPVRSSAATESTRPAADRR